MTGDRNPDAALDDALAQWARHDAGDADAVARIMDHADAITAPSVTAPVTVSPVTAPAREMPMAKPALAEGRPGQDRRNGRRLVPFAMGGGAIAAGIAIALMAAPQPGGWGGQKPAKPGAATEQGAYALATNDRELDSVAMLFTLTAEEEQYL